MAESIVSFVVEKLGKLLIEEAVFLHGVADQVEWVKTELKRMQYFLKDAEDKRRKGDERVRNWVGEVRDVAYQVEYVIDDVMYMAYKRRLRRGSFIGLISRYAHIPKELISHHKIGTEIERIKNKIRDISESRQRYGIANLGESGDEVTSNIDDTLQARRRLFPQLDVLDRDVVGVEDAKKALIKQLLDLNNAQRCVISIVGMGGLGKTTLASRIYNSPDIKTHFSILVWLTVSQDYSTIGLLKGILRKVTSIATEELEKMSEEHVREKMYEILKGVRYLVVLDDVWTDVVWRQIQNIFPDKNNGSRVMLTTRNIEVAKSADPITPPHELRLLNDEESWELFCKKAFPGNLDTQTGCPQELEGLSRELARRCGGLPLALVVLGGLLSRKEQTYSVWLKVNESMVWELTADGQECLNILALSYNDLPHHYLKSCFIYIGAFPEDTNISVSLLIRLWIAEGFIPHRTSETLEETARGYLDELVQRCMVQVTVKSLAHGWTKRIHIHDMFRGFCISEARNDGIMNICSSNTDISSSFSSAMAARRLAVTNFNGELPDLHSLLLFEDTRYSVDLRRSLKRLRVFHGQDIISFTECSPFLTENQTMKHLRYLRYLRLTLESNPPLPEVLCRGFCCCCFGCCYCCYCGCRCCRRCRRCRRTCQLDYLFGIFITIVNEPKLLLRNLYNIITLDVEYRAQVNGIIWESSTLRHLYIRDTEHPIRPPATFSFSNLQVLWGVRAGKWIGRSLANHTNLRKLGIRYISTSHHKKLTTSLQKLDRLATLLLHSHQSIPTEVLTIFQNQQHLHVLKLVGKFSKGPQLPPSNEFPPRLTKLVLSFCKLEHDPMPTLEKLPNLIYLCLGDEAYVRKSMSCSTSGFPRLRHLKLEWLYNMEDWSVTGGAMPSLTQLSIGFCSRLTMLPHGLQLVTSLQELQLDGMSKEFIGRVDKDCGEDWYKIQHVPSVIIRNTMD